jgi:tetratricopeptide (TPR) repeat protein
MPERRSVSTCVLLLLSLSSAAYGQQRISLLRGELQSDSPLMHLNDYQVEVVANNDRIGGERAQVRVDGTFFLHDVVPGNSHLRVLDSRGEAVVEQYVSVQEGLMISVRLPAPPASRVPTGRISARELAHPTPPKAIKEYLAAKKAAAAGDLDKSIAHFERAVEIHPDFFEAWNDLGVSLTRQKRFPEAVEAFRKASKLAPDSAMIGQNLRVAQFWASKTVLK